MTPDVKCPYCSEGQEINHNDGYGYKEDFPYDQQCSKCSKKFVYTTSIIYCYNAKKADCLNGSEHNYKFNLIFPRFLSEMSCIDCVKTRILTPNEKFKYKVTERCKKCIIRDSIDLGLCEYCILDK